MVERRFVFGVAVGVCDAADCSSGHVVPEWRSGAVGGDEEIFKKNGGYGSGDMGDGGSDTKPVMLSPIISTSPDVIHVRNYTEAWRWRTALMMSRLATEPEPRWLRSDMLASGVFDWDLRERVGTHRSRAVTVRFSVKGKHQSASVDRTILLELRPSVFRPVDRRPEARLALDLAWP